MQSKGQCHGVFLLCRAVKFKHRKDIVEWVESAKQSSTLMARAIDLERVAVGLFRLGLASQADHVVLDKALLSLTDIADQKTLIAIATRLMVQNPPFWLRIAVKQGVVSREYIPKAALENLIWMGVDLDQFLIDVRYAVSDSINDEFIKVFGDVAEELILAGLERIGLVPSHVSKISDEFGYDIEYTDTKIRRLEVKAATENTSGRFHLSRNEFNKSIRHGDEWQLVQLIFHSSAFGAKKIAMKHVRKIVELRPGSLTDVIPADTINFKWNGTAIIVPQGTDWKASNILLDPDFETDGFRARLELKK
jgi:hypothetical protein